jgi:hypothetical protein
MHVYNKTPIDFKDLTIKKKIEVSTYLSLDSVAFSMVQKDS